MPDEQYHTFRSSWDYILWSRNHEISHSEAWVQTVCQIQLDRTGKQNPSLEDNFHHGDDSQAIGESEEDSAISE
jgi:hypothetical protein